MGGRPSPCETKRPQQTVGPHLLLRARPKLLLLLLLLLLMVNPLLLVLVLLRTRHATEVFWKGSSSKGYFLAGVPVYIGSWSVPAAASDGTTHQ